MSGSLKAYTKKFVLSGLTDYDAAPLRHFWAVATGVADHGYIPGIFIAIIGKKGAMST